MATRCNVSDNWIHFKEEGAGVTAAGCIIRQVSLSLKTFSVHHYGLPSWILTGVKNVVRNAEGGISYS